MRARGEAPWSPRLRTPPARPPARLNSPSLCSLLRHRRLSSCIACNAVLRRVGARLLPLFFAVSFLCQLDRSNLAFAALQMDKDLGLNRTVQGLGSGRPAPKGSIDSALVPPAAERQEQREAACACAPQEHREGSPGPPLSCTISKTPLLHLPANKCNHRPVLHRVPGAAARQHGLCGAGGAALAGSNPGGLGLRGGGVCCRARRGRLPGAAPAAGPGGKWCLPWWAAGREWAGGGGCESAASRAVGGRPQQRGPQGCGRVSSPGQQ